MRNRGERTRDKSEKKTPKLALGMMLPNANACHLGEKIVMKC